MIISSFSLAAINNEFAEQIQLYLMKNLVKNQKEKTHRSHLLLGGPLMVTAKRSPRTLLVELIPKMVRGSEGELLVFRVHLAAKAVYVVIHMPRFIVVGVWPGCGPVPDCKSTSTLGASTERTSPPEPEYQYDEPDQNDQTHDLERAHISLLCASGTVWILCWILATQQPRKDAFLSYCVARKLTKHCKEHISIYYVKYSIFDCSCQAQQKITISGVFRPLIRMIKKFSSPKMRNREFVFTPKIEYELVAERSEANQNSLTFPIWCVCLTKSEPILNRTDGALRAPNRSGEVEFPS